MQSVLCWLSFVYHLSVASHDQSHLVAFFNSVSTLDHLTAISYYHPTMSLEWKLYKFYVFDVVGIFFSVISLHLLWACLIFYFSISLLIWVDCHSKVFKDVVYKISEFSSLSYTLCSQLSCVTS